MRTRANLARHEWIGLKARVEASSDPSQARAEGLIVDETLRTVTLERPSGREAVLQKRGTRMAFELPSGEPWSLDLGALEYRPWDRVKRAKAGLQR